MSMRLWNVYIVECRDGTLYTGITNDLERRMAEHNRGAGCRYTSGRRPVKLCYCESFCDRSSAMRREAAIKGLSKREKLILIDAAV